jgi:hypothetical protein
MLYGYRFTLAQMGQIKNWKKDKKIHALLTSIEDLPLSMYEVDCEVFYKKTVPLNMFEKYSIRLIEKANETYSELTMNIGTIAKLLHLDEKLIESNLVNLSDIGMLHGVESDSITINRDENSEYLQYENKFKVESFEANYHLTELEFEKHESYIQKDFEKGSEQEGKKFKSINILETKESNKNVDILNYNDGSFHVFGQKGVDQASDLKFISKDTLDPVNETNSIPENVFCHYEEFLPLLRDHLAINRDEIVVIAAQEIDDKNLDVFKAVKNLSDLYILSRADVEHERIFNIEVDDLAWVGDDYYTRSGNYIIKSNDKTLKQTVQQKLKNFFFSKILEIEPNYDSEKSDEISYELSELNEELSKYEFRNKKEIDEKIKRLNTERNTLYGLTSSKSKTRSEQRKKIDNFEKSGNEKELEKYPEYIKNRELIIEYKEKVNGLNNQLEEINKLNQKISELNHVKSSLISNENKQKLSPLENELKKLERLKI